jgi:hypothetical protein
MSNKTKDKLMLNGTHRHSVYADDDLLGKSINTAKKQTKSLLDAGKKIEVEVRAEKGKNIFMNRHQTTGQYNIKLAN